MADSIVGDIGKFAWEFAVCRISQLASEIDILSQSLSIGGSNGCANELTNCDHLGWHEEEKTRNVNRNSPM